MTEKNSGRRGREQEEKRRRTAKAPGAQKGSQLKSTALQGRKRKETAWKDTVWKETARKETARKGADPKESVSKGEAGRRRTEIGRGRQEAVRRGAAARRMARDERNRQGEVVRGAAARRMVREEQNRQEEVVRGAAARRMTREERNPQEEVIRGAAARRMAREEKNRQEEVVRGAETGNIAGEEKELQADVSRERSVAEGAEVLPLMDEVICGAEEPFIEAVSSGEEEYLTEEADPGAEDYLTEEICRSTEELLMEAVFCNTEQASGKEIPNLNIAEVLDPEAVRETEKVLETEKNPDQKEVLNREEVLNQEEDREVSLEFAEPMEAQEQREFREGSLSESRVLLDSSEQEEVDWLDDDLEEDWSDPWEGERDQESEDGSSLEQAVPGNSDGAVSEAEREAEYAEQKELALAVSEIQRRGKRSGWLHRIQRKDHKAALLLAACIGVLIFTGITGFCYLRSWKVAQQVAAFEEIGSGMKEIGVIGESGLLAMSDAWKSRAIREAEEAEAARAAAEAALEGPPEYEEKELDRSVQVSMHVSSMQKDLKIKFTNTKTGKLMASTAFEVSVTTADKKSYVLKDEDQDGIIYQTGVTPGKCQVVMKDVMIDGKEIKGETVSVEIKDKIEYKKVDIADEVKTEAEVNAAAEDTGKKNKAQESSLKDTVGWVASSKTAADTGKTSSASEAGYEEVTKDQIPDPLTLTSARAERMGDASEISRYSFRMDLYGAGETRRYTEEETLHRLYAAAPEQSGDAASAGDQTAQGAENTENSQQSSQEGENGSASADSDQATGNGQQDGADQNQKDQNQEAGESGNGQNQEAGNNGNGQGQETGNSGSGQGQEPGTESGQSGQQPQDPATENKKEDSQPSGGQTAENGTQQTPAAGTAQTIKVSLSHTSLELAVGEQAVIQAKTEPAGSHGQWSVTDSSILTVKDGTVTAVAAGQAEVVLTMSDGTQAVCKVTVHKGSLQAKLELNASEVRLTTGGTVKLEAVLTGLTDSRVTWQSDQKEVAEVGEDGTVTGKAPGTAVITVSAAGDSSLKASCKVLVQKHPEKDTETKLKDKDGNQLYIKDSSGAFREAVYADYYTADKFYKKTKETSYKYTGWQTLDGKTYYYDAEGKKVTGEQIIQGARYVFDSNGVLSTSSGSMGIDVSKWNGNIDWKAVKNAGVSYVIIRCGYRGSTTGALIQDPKFKANIKGAASVGLKVGIYFFTQAINEVEAVEEASMVLDLIRGYSISYPVFLDVEASGGRADSISKSARTEVCRAFCQTIQNGGYTAGIYANSTWLRTHINTASLTGYKIWLAQYAAKPTYNATRYDIWQYSAKGSVAGIKGDVDLNISYMK